MSESQREVMMFAVRAAMGELSASVWGYGMPRNTTKRTFRDLFEAASTAGLDVEEYREDYNQFDLSKGA
jgi:hypothetical protein